MTNENKVESKKTLGAMEEIPEGLTITQEQVSDVYAEGEIMAVIDDVNGKDIPIERKGYE